MNKPNPRSQFLHCRVTETEREQVENIILDLDVKGARKLGAQIAQRLADAAPFATVSDYLRICCGLDPLRDEGDAVTGRPRSKTPSKATLHQRAKRGDGEAKKLLAEMGVKTRGKRKPKEEICQGKLKITAFSPE